MVKQTAFIGGMVLVLSSWVLPSGLAAAPKSASASASFLINPTGARETAVEIDVAEDSTGALVNLVYNVRSTSEEGDFLFYHAITGGGPVAPQDFDVFPGGRVAILDTTIPAFDDEGGVDFELGVTVIWISTGSSQNGTRRAFALGFFDFPFNSQYLTDFFITDDASISVSK